MLSQLKKIKDHQRSYGHIYCDSLIQIVSDLWTDKRRDGRQAIAKACLAFGQYR